MKALIMCLMVIVGIYAIMTFSGLQTTIENRTSNIDRQVIAAMK